MCTEPEPEPERAATPTRSTHDGGKGARAGGARFAAAPGGDAEHGDDGAAKTVDAVRASRTPDELTIL